MGRGDRGWAGECKRFNTEDTEEMREGTEAAGMDGLLFSRRSVRSRSLAVLRDDMFFNFCKL
jgi:hypothetical protein